MKYESFEWVGSRKMTCFRFVRYGPLVTRRSRRLQADFGRTIRPTIDRTEPASESRDFRVDRSDD